MEQIKKMKSGWNVKESTFAKNTLNPIRTIVDGMKLNPHPDKTMIALSIGDPTVFGNLSLPDEIETAVIRNVKSKKANGYAPSIGYESTRAAVAKYSSTVQSQVEAKDVILTSGCSGALDICITVLASPGQNILCPRPGFSIYKTLAVSLGIQVQFYDLIPERSWEVDLEHMDSLVNDNTAAIIVNNPSNPCGSVYSKEHLQDILEIAEKYKIPVIADEIYEHFVYPGEEYHSLASLSKDVPILSCSGLTKRYLVPGWRLGWIVINDRHDAFEKEVRKGLVRLSQRILGPNTVMQAAVEEILFQTPDSFYDNVVKFVQENALLAFYELSKIPGLSPVMPKGAMYMMIGIDMHKFPEFENEVEFTERMVTEQSVFCLPASCFQYPNFFRIVLTPPREKIEVACARITEFCADHYCHANGTNGNHVGK